LEGVGGGVVDANVVFEEALSGAVWGFGGNVVESWMGGGLEDKFAAFTVGFERDVEGGC